MMMGIKSLQLGVTQRLKIKGIDIQLFCFKNLSSSGPLSTFLNSPAVS